jgi:hypothetical protein
MKVIKSNKLSVRTVNKAVQKDKVIIIGGSQHIEEREHKYKSGPLWKTKPIKRG